MPAQPDLDRPTDARVERFWIDGRAAWPTVDLARSTYATWVRTHWPIDVERAADLYLACACAAGDPEAQARFDAAYRPLIERALHRLVDDPSAVGDLVHHVLIVAVLGDTPRIAGYAGRGPLSSWIAVVASRAAVDALRRQGRAEQRTRRMASWVESAAEDAELAYLRRTYRDALEDAFEAALGELSTRTRLLLRYRAVEGLGLDAIAALFGVHRVTVSRWLARDREALMQRTRTLLVQATGLRESEVDSVHRLVASQIDVSLARLLGSASD